MIQQISCGFPAQDYEAVCGIIGRRLFHSTPVSSTTLDEVAHTQFVATSECVVDLWRHDKIQKAGTEISFCTSNVIPWAHKFLRLLDEVPETAETARVTLEERYEQDILRWLEVTHDLTQTSFEVPRVKLQKLLADLAASWDEFTQNVDTVLKLHALAVYERFRSSGEGGKDPFLPKILAYQLALAAKAFR